MPHWYGLIETSSPPILKSCNGNSRCVQKSSWNTPRRERTFARIVWLKDQNVAGITVEGPAARDYLTTLEASNVVELEVSGPLDR